MMVDSQGSFFRIIESLYGKTRNHNVDCYIVLEHVACERFYSIFQRTFSVILIIDR